MRWIRLKEGERRIIPVFTLFPRCINDEVVWLEWVYILQELHYCFQKGFFYYWEDLKLLEKDEVIKVERKLWQKDLYELELKESLPAC